MHPFAYEALQKGHIKCFPVPLYSEKTYTDNPVIFPDSFGAISDVDFLVAQAFWEHYNHDIWFELSIIDFNGKTITQPELQQRIYDIWEHRNKPHIGGLVVTAQQFLQDKMRVMNLKRSRFILSNTAWLQLMLGKQIKFGKKEVEFLVFAQTGADVYGSKSKQKFNFNLFKPMETN